MPGLLHVGVGASRRRLLVSDLGDPTTSWSTQPASGTYDVSYDVWFNWTPTMSGQPDAALA
jgi:hypothetical protein